ncbi:hypothetical protein ACQ4LK_24925, partial [Bacillus pumilus]
MSQPRDYMLLKNHAFIEFFAKKKQTAASDLLCYLLLNTHFFLHNSGNSSHIFLSLIHISDPRDPL